MPVFAMPMMMPVMPAMATMPVQATRGAEPRGATGDCCDRVDELEREMKRLARSMTELQDIVHGQTEILKVLAQDHVAHRAAEPKVAPKAGAAAQAPAK
jgi:hypothetical protein